MSLARRDVPYRPVFLRPSLMQGRANMFSGMTESGVLAGFAVISPDMFSHIADVSFFTDNIALQWLGTTATRRSSSHRRRIGSGAASRQSPLDTMSRPRCRAHLHSDSRARGK